MGGKNIIIVMDDANLDLAVEGAVWGGFGTSGQRCTAASRSGRAQKSLQGISRSIRGPTTKALKLSDGLDPDTDVGPLISGTQLQTVMNYVEIGKNEGAKAGGGRQPG